MASAAELAIVISGKNEVSKTLGDVEKSASGLGKTIGQVGTIASGFLAANVVQAGVQKLTGFIGDSISAAKESIAVNAQLDTVLKSTGGAAGVTAKQVQDMGARLERLSVFEDEAIISSSNLLLTFTNIGGNVLPRAQQAVLDMSQALGQDLSSSSVQLGKALNDPINGITALSRVGVSFTEDQKEMITSMVEAGDVAGAQALILAELEKEFGGSAKAASDAAGASERYKDKMNDLQEQIGTKMLPIQEKITEAKLAMVNLIATKVIPILEELYAKHWPAVSKAIEDVVAFIETTWPQIQPVFEFAAQYVIARIEGMIQVIKSIIEIVTSVVNLVSAIFHGEWARAWEEMKDIASATIDLVMGVIKTQFGSIPEIMIGAARSAVDGFVNVLGSLPGEVRNVANQVINLLNSLIRKWNDLELRAEGPLGIGSISVGTPNAPMIPHLQHGTPFVPRDMLAFLHRGEAVIPAAQNHGDMGVTVNNYGPIYARDEDDARRAGGDLGWAVMGAMKARGVRI